MALLHALVQVVVMLMYTKFTLQEVMLFRASKNLKIGKMLHLHDVRLNITAFAIEEFPNEMKCVASCVTTDKCYCVNVKEQANGVRCELLNRTIYHYPKYLTRDASSSHWFAEVQFVFLYHSLFTAFFASSSSAAFRLFLTDHYETLQKYYNDNYLVKMLHNEKIFR